MASSTYTGGFVTATSGSGGFSTVTVTSRKTTSSGALPYGPTSSMEYAGPSAYGVWGGRDGEWIEE